MTDEEELIQTFHREGYLCLRKVLPLEQIEQWAQQYENTLQDTFTQLYQNRHIEIPTYQNPTTGSYTLGQGVKHGFAEIVMRSPGRFEIAVPTATTVATTTNNHMDTIHSILQTNLALLPKLLRNPSSTNDTARASSGSNCCRTSFETNKKEDTANDEMDSIQIVRTSLVIATPGATVQGWHTDGCHMSCTQHLPCHCLNVFIPLMASELDPAILGPTQLRPQSHYITRTNFTQQLLLAKARKTLIPPIAPILDPGDCLVFDYRILHRGLSNQHPTMNRTILVITLAQPWFRDVVNFPKRSLYNTHTTTDTTNQQIEEEDTGEIEKVDLG